MKKVRLQITNGHKKSWVEVCSWSAKLEDILENLDEDDEDTNCRHLKIGSSVTHPTYGRGTIKSMDHDFGILKATIDFFDFGLRKVSLHHLETVKSLGGISYDYHR